MRRLQPGKHDGNPEMIIQIAGGRERGIFLTEQKGKKFLRGRLPDTSRNTDHFDRKCLPILGRMLDRFQDNEEAAPVCVKAIASFNKKAIRQLIAALDSKNAGIRKAAVEELKEICGVDFGTDKSRWEQWEKNRGTSKN